MMPRKCSEVIFLSWSGQESRSKAEGAKNLRPVLIASQRLARKAVKATLLHRRKSLNSLSEANRVNIGSGRRTIGSRVKNLKMAIE
jgi:hypothetical protein